MYLISYSFLLVSGNDSALACSPLLAHFSHSGLLALCLLCLVSPARSFLPRRLQVLVRFLKKLSRVEENVHRMLELKVVPSLARLVPASASRSREAGRDGNSNEEGKDAEAVVAADGLTSAALRLLVNLAFDADQRAAMVGKHVATPARAFAWCSFSSSLAFALLLWSFLLLFFPSFFSTSRSQVQAGLVPRLVALLAAQPRHRAHALKLLYLLSFDDRHKALFAHTDAVPVVMQMIVNFPGDLLGKELAALAVSHNWVVLRSFVLVGRF